jgi:hypothetical protein
MEVHLSSVEQAKKQSQCFHPFELPMLQGLPTRNRPNPQGGLVVEFTPWSPVTSVGSARYVVFMLQIPWRTAHSPPATL